MKESFQSLTGFIHEVNAFNRPMNEKSRPRSILGTSSIEGVRSIDGRLVRIFVGTLAILPEAGYGFEGNSRRPRKLAEQFGKLIKSGSGDQQESCD